MNGLSKKEFLIILRSDNRVYKYINYKRELQLPIQIQIPTHPVINLKNLFHSRMYPFSIRIIDN